MIGVQDSFTLACTKLGTKKPLLITTIIVASLLFGVIITGIIVAAGVSRSANQYLKSALDGKYLVAVNPVIPSDVLGFTSTAEVPSKELKQHLTDLQAQYIANQEKIAKQYSVEFDSKSIDPILKPSPFGMKDTLGNVQEVINRNSPVYQLYIDELQENWVKTANNTLTNLKSRANAKGATAYYQNQYASLDYMNTLYMPNGKDDLSKVVQPNPTGYDPYTYSVQNSSYVFTDQSLVKRYIWSVNEKRRENKTAIPVVISKQEAVKLFGNQLGFGKEPMDAASKIKWMETLQQKLNGFTYQACYRSAGEVKLIQEAMRQNQAVDEKDLISYGLPTSPCTPVTIRQDSRTAAQKRSDSNILTYQKASGTYQSEITQLLTFQVVGVMSPATSLTGTLTDLPTLVDNLLGAQYQGGAFIPNQLYEQLPITAQHRGVLQSQDSLSGADTTRLTNAGVAGAIISFPTATMAKKFIDKDTCYTQDQGGCGKPWTSQIEGANYLLTEDIGRKAFDIAKLALPIALLIAAIIMSFAMARVIIDSRHETAVFRALGAKRVDIMRIYITYSILVACIVMLSSLAIGAVGSALIETLYGAEITNYAKVAYGVFNNLGSFNLIGFDVVHMGMLMAVILAVGLIAILPPLIRNIRRNPIQDMRNE